MTFASLLDDVALAGPLGLSVVSLFSRAAACGLLPKNDDGSVSVELSSRLTLLRDFSESLASVTLLGIDGAVVQSVTDVEGVERVIAGLALARRACGVSPEVVLSAMSWRILWYVGTCRTAGAPAAVAALRKAANLPLVNKSTMLVPLLAA